MIERTPSDRSAAMFARAGISCGAYSWCRPWRETKAIGTGFASDEDDGVWCRIEIGEEGFPHGVEMFSSATGVKPGRLDRPVPPMTAIRTGSSIHVSAALRVETR